MIEVLGTTAFSYEKQKKKMSFQNMQVIYRHVVENVLI